MLNKITWYLRQLVPLTYRTTYGSKGVKRFAVWRMWMGRCFAVDDFAIG